MNKQKKTDIFKRTESHRTKSHKTPRSKIHRTKSHNLYFFTLADKKSQSIFFTLADKKSQDKKSQRIRKQQAKVIIQKIIGKKNMVIQRLHKKRQ